MDYHCKVCDKPVKIKNKHKRFKSKTHKEFDKCKHIKLTIENPLIKDIDRIFFAYIIEQNKKLDYHLVKSGFQSV